LKLIWVRRHSNRDLGGRSTRRYTLLPTHVLRRGSSIALCTGDCQLCPCQFSASQEHPEAQNRFRREYGFWAPVPDCG
jgi:hypothetical protein